MSISAGLLTFDFEPTVQTAQFEVGGAVAAGWPEGHKVVDIVATDVRRCWLIEAKDYRVITQPPKRANLATLPTTMDRKVRQTLLGMAAYVASGTDPTLVAHAKTALSKAKRKVVLHLEPHPANGPHSALFPRRFPALVLQKLKQLVKGIDAKPLVLDIASTPDARVPWTVT